MRRNIFKTIILTAVLLAVPALASPVVTIGGAGASTVSAAGNNGNAGNNGGNNNGGNNAGNNAGNNGGNNAGNAAGATPAPTSCPTGSSAKAQVLQGLGATGSDCDPKPVNSLFAVAVNILSIIVGVVSIIVILISSLKFMTSNGDQNKVANAKGTLTYALIGLAVAALAQLLVHLVLYHATSLGQ